MGRQSSKHVDNAANVGKRLRQARANARLTQRELSFPGCTAAYISRIEAGDRVPSLQMIHQLAQRLGVSAQWLATGIDALPAEGDIVEAEVALRLGDAREARRIFSARNKPEDPARPAALAGLGQIAFREGKPAEAIDLLEQSLKLRGGKPLADPSAVDTLGRAYAQAGRLDDAVGLFAGALADARTLGAVLEQLRFAVLLANSLIDRGTFGEAEETLANVIEIAEGLQEPMAAARVFWTQSRLKVLRGEPHVAARYARRALEILERTENDAYVAMAYHLVAFSEIEAGNPKPALALLERGRALFGDALSAGEDAKFALEEARALSLVKRHREAAETAARAVELIGSLDPQDQGRAYMAVGDVFDAAKDVTRALEAYREGVRLLSEYGQPYLAAAARRLAEVLEREGDIDGALAALKLVPTDHGARTRR